MLQTGDLLDGKYRILKVIGSGGMSVVYLALNERANKHWAVKELRKDRQHGEGVGRHSLLAELEVLKKIRHPGLPRIIDVIDTEDSLQIVMDYIHGRTLQELLRDFGPPDQDTVLDWARQLCDVLIYLHSREPPVIYRDMKPANIMLTPEGKVILIDFGTALEMDGGGDEDICLGTRGYASPEQYGGAGRADSRSDIYCLGVTLHHLLTGHAPDGPPLGLRPLRYYNPSLSEGLERIIIRCTRDDPEERYQDCQDLLYDLEHHERIRLGYHQRVIASLRLFSVFFSVSLFLGTAALLSGLYYRHLIREEYTACLEKAGQALTFGAMEKEVRKAVALDRGEPAAYSLMLSYVTSDGLMTDQEKSAMESLLYEKRDGRTNIALFRRHRKAYDSFSYDMGLACFFYYKGSRGKDIARIWFEGLEGSSLPEGKKIRASIYARIGTYYASLDQLDGNREGAVGGYTEFFRDLSSLNMFTPDDIGNPGTAAALYSEIAEQLGESAGDFLSKGDHITPYMLRIEIAKIKEYAAYDCMKTCGKEIRDKLTRNIEDADIKIDAVCGQYGRNEAMPRSDEKDQEDGPG